MVTRHAEIAGAGLSGLMAATRLAQLGWSVRLHERSSELRMFGAGIWLWENGLQSLQAAGALDTAVARAQVIKEWRISDERGTILFRRPMTAEDRLLLPPRADLYEALIQRVEQLGVDIVTNSVAVAARPEGVLELATGKENRAELVIAADGAFSRVRESVLCTASIDYGIEAGIRMLIDRAPGYPADLITEYWNDRWRLLYNPCTEGQDYIFLSAPVGDERARRSPIDRDMWREKFPTVTDVIDRFTEASKWDRLVNVRCRAWSAGKVAIIGDAAHAMPPNLGQAANMAFTNAMSLAAAVTDNEDIELALQEWERSERPLTDYVQRFSYYYGFFLGRWPTSLLALRGDVLRLFRSSSWFEQALNRGMRHMPVRPASSEGCNDSRAAIGSIKPAPIDLRGQASKVSYPQEAS
jgi:2-polyprenyl-6-methoxyphenol hydroxylase-like FAD-dependent oxidoreductase